MKAKYKLRANWSKSEMDIMLHWPLGVGTRADGSYLSDIFNQDFIKQMEQRGYDITKMKFEIPIKKGARPVKFRTLLNELTKEDE